VSEWRDQLRKNYSFGKKMVSDLYEILRYNPNLPLKSITDSLQKRGHVRATSKNTRKYLEKDPAIGKKQDTSDFTKRPMVYYLKEEKL
tara:strand:+ start:210 stop:473 length:264 start_codon:yes stop_codon:yes gene_type:complete